MKKCHVKAFCERDLKLSMAEKKSSEAGIEYLENQGNEDDEFVSKEDSASK